MGTTAVETHESHGQLKQTSEVQTRGTKLPPSELDPQSTQVSIISLDRQPPSYLPL